MGQVVREASCPWGELSVGRAVPGGELSVGRIVHGAKCPWGGLSMGRTVCGANCLWGELSWGELSWVEFWWGEFWWDEWFGNQPPPTPYPAPKKERETGSNDSIIWRRHFSSRLITSRSSLPYVNTYSYNACWNSTCKLKTLLHQHSVLFACLLVFKHVYK
jgi:hypothetical protein